jgi:hypothetical protein
LQFSSPAVASPAELSSASTDVYEVLRKKSPGNSTQIMALCERGRGPLSPPGESSIPRSRSAGLFAYYVKSFTSWNPLLALVYAQFSSAVSLRGLEAGWNANRQHHYHLGSGPLVRSTLADASKRRPVAVFAETFSLLASQLDRPTRRHRHGEADRFDADPARQAVRLGQIERAHPRPEDARRL